MPPPTSPHSPSHQHPSTPPEHDDDDDPDQRHHQSDGSDPLHSPTPDDPADLPDADADPPEHRFDDDIENDNDNDNESDADGATGPGDDDNDADGDGDGDADDRENDNDGGGDDGDAREDEGDNNANANNNNEPERDDNASPRTPSNPTPATPQPTPTPLPPSTPQTPSSENPAAPFTPLLTLLSRTPPATLVTTWLTHIATNGPAAVAAALSLVVGIGRPVLSGARAEPLITADMIVNLQPPEVVSNLAPILSSDVGGRVPILARDAQSRRARRAFEEFWRRLPVEAGDAVLFDTDCFETVMLWLEAMAVGGSRGLRTAACIAAYCLVDGFITFGSRIKKQIAGLQRQLTTEKNKCGITGSAGRGRTKEKMLSAKGKELARKVEDISANDSEVTEFCDKAFRGTFILKCRDVAPDIRILSVKALGSWIMSYPQHFLDEMHNKYIGWLLYDKNAGVRKASLDVLLSIMQKKDFFPSLELFFNRFRDRVVEMCRDRDDSVVVAAINLLTCLLPYDVVTQESCEPICDVAIEEAQVDIRRAAGEFLANIILLQSGAGDATSLANGRRRARKPSSARGKRALSAQAKEFLGEVPQMEMSREHIKQLLFAVTRKAEDMSPALVVDAVWNHLPALRCWEAFFDLLLEKPPSSSSKERSRRSSRGSRGRPSSRPSTADSEEMLGETDKAVLCEMLMLSGTEATGHGDATRAKIIAQSTIDDEESVAMSFSRHMIVQLPKLLLQFQSDGRAMKALVQVPKLFSVGALAQEGREEHLKALLQRLVDALTRHTGQAGVASACSDTFRQLLSDENPLKGATVSSLRMACKAASSEFSVAMRSDLMESEPETVAATVLRVRVLSQLVEPSTTIFEPLVKLLEYQLTMGTSSAMVEDVTIDGARALATLTIWSMLKVRSRMDGIEGSRQDVDNVLGSEDIKEEQHRGANVVALLLRMCRSENIVVDVKIICMQVLLTILTLCCGIEKLLGAKMADGEDDAEKERLTDRVDLLNVKKQRDEVAETVTSCMVEIVEHEYMATRRQGRRQEPRGGLGGRVVTSSDELRGCFAALVQASWQSVVSKEIAHVALLGLLLKGRRVRGSTGDVDVSTVDLCKRYLEDVVRLGGWVGEGMRALIECERMERAKSARFACSRELGEVMVGLRRGGVERNEAAVELVMGLVKWVKEEEKVVETVVNGVRLVCSVGTGLLGSLKGDGAERVREEMKGVEDLLKEEWIVEECGEVGASVEGFLKALEVVEQGGRNGRRRVGDGGEDEEEEGVGEEEEGGDEGEGEVGREENEEEEDGGKQTEVVTVRKSTRVRKAVNYAPVESNDKDVEMEDAEEGDSGEGDEMEVEGNDEGKEGEGEEEEAEDGKEKDGDVGGGDGETLQEGNDESVGEDRGENVEGEGEEEEGANDFLLPDTGVEREVENGDEEDGGEENGEGEGVDGRRRLRSRGVAMSKGSESESVGATRRRSSRKRGRVNGGEAAANGTENEDGGEGKEERGRRSKRARRATGSGSGSGSSSGNGKHVEEGDVNGRVAGRAVAGGGMGRTQARVSSSGVGAVGRRSGRRRRSGR